MLKQPVSVVKMTNVAIIRYRLTNKSFEVACYRNTAINYRNGQETPLEEVLQSEEIYENASHGTIAPMSDIKKYFPNKSKREVIEIILYRGELQVTDKEREAKTNQLSHEVALIVMEKCVHPISKRQLPLESIKEAIK